MTEREFYTAVLNKEITEEVKVFAACKLNNLNEYKKKKDIENEPIVNAIKTALFNDEHLASDIAKFVNEHYMTVTTSKVSAILLKLAEEGIVTITTIRIPKVGKRNYYEMVASNDDKENEEYINQYNSHEITTMID